MQQAQKVSHERKTLIQVYCPMSTGDQAVSHKVLYPFGDSRLYLEHSHLTSKSNSLGLPGRTAQFKVWTVVVVCILQTPSVNPKQDKNLDAMYGQRGLTSKKHERETDLMDNMLAN